uniref:PhoH-like protein n=1 Tax=uncultured bacterium contig00027 TaxID=1181516 RepID=A0A806K0Z1_9BACT|nr:phosphate starvation-inducible protein PhoH, predicted ATPase [uncultured bacterium contig00027]
MTDRVTIAFDNRELLSGICGANDGNLRIIEGSLGGFITARGNEIHFESPNEIQVMRFKTMMNNLIASIQEGEEPSPEYIRALVSELSDKSVENSGENSEDKTFFKKAGDNGNSLIRDYTIQIPHGLRHVYPRTGNQAVYIKGMKENEICFCIGPAGTGKTYLAVAWALYMVLSKKMRKLVLTRPVVEAGENLGFLPGDLREKIDPYLRPLHDAMESLIPYDVINKMEETRSIEIAPLAYMRGRSLNECMIILDEAQNTTREQMKMFLTRIGSGARAVITGDATQIDLPRKPDSGLLHVLEILRNIEGINFSFLHTADVARNPLIKKIIQVYNEA